MMATEVNTMSDLLPKPEVEKLRARAAEIDHPHEMIVDVLRAIQDHHGWVPDEGVQLTAAILGVTPVEVDELATFYDKIYRRPVGRKVIHVCDSVCCWATGTDKIVEHLRQKLGIDPGQTSADGMFTLLPTCCLGVCGDAPAMMIGLTTYGPLTVEDVDRILDQESHGATAAEKIDS